MFLILDEICFVNFTSYLFIITKLINTTSVKNNLKGEHYVK